MHSAYQQRAGKLLSINALRRWPIVFDPRDGRAGRSPTSRARGCWLKLRIVGETARGVLDPALPILPPLNAGFSCFPNTAIITSLCSTMSKFSYHGGYNRWHGSSLSCTRLSRHYSRSRRRESTRSHLSPTVGAPERHRRPGQVRRCPGPASPARPLFQRLQLPLNVSP
jgi:hypothetical protein